MAPPSPPPVAAAAATAGPRGIKRRRRKGKKDNGRNNKKPSTTHGGAILKDWADETGISLFSGKSLEQSFPKAKRKASSVLPLPVLLRQRELGLVRRGRIDKWQSQVLVEPVDEHNEQFYEVRETLPKYQYQMQWRKFARRSIPFSQLATPSTDAVLAVERRGSYVLSLGGGGGGSGSSSLRTTDIHNNNNNIAGDTFGNGERRLPVLSLNFYGIPSHSVAANGKRRLEGTNNSQSEPVSPLLKTITLLSESASERAASRNRVGFLSAVLTVPIRLLISSDWRIGVAFLREDTMMAASFPDRLGDNRRKDECLGRLILFSLPQPNNMQQPYVQTFQCSNVRMGAFHAFTMRNLLWKVDCVPYNHPSHVAALSNRTLNQSICNSILIQPAYIVVNDEDDGFRLTWVKEASWRAEDGTIEPLETSTTTPPNDPAMPDILSTHEKAWEERFNDSITGVKFNTGEPLQNLSTAPPTTSRDLSMAFEAYLSVETLLGRILSGRKKLADEFTPKDDDENRFPEYFYNLLSVNNDGRTMELVVAFRNSRKIGCVGVFVSLDLFTQEYVTQSWVRNANVTSSSSLQNLCNSLALNYRMRQLRLGPYSVDPQDSTSWEGLCKQNDCEFSFDLERDSNPILWEPFMNHVKEDRERGVSRKKTQQLIPKGVSYASLYPDCELVTNRAVAHVKPVSSLTGRMSPVEIVYGSSGILGRM